MNKLINKNTIQYIKQGKVLYGQKGLDVDINKFSDSYTSESSLRREIFDYIRNLAPNAPTEYYEQMFKKIVDNYYVKDGSSYFKKTSSTGRNKLMERRLTPVKGYSDYFRDPQTGQLYRKRWAVQGRLSHEVYDPINKDVLDINGKTLLKAYENGNFGKYHTEQDAGYGNWQGQKIAVRYNKDNKTWAFNPVDDNDNTWLDADDALSKYLNRIYKNLQTSAEKPQDKVEQEDPSENNTELDAAPGAAKPDTDPGVAAPGAADAGSLVNYFDPLLTDPRTILRSTRLSKPTTTVVKPKKTLRVLPKTVARPENMPLMNRSDVRYTISDITGGSPYDSSDIELVNSLANTSDKNMFKQALMNRLQMSKWDNEIALNRLNSLGIKGHIGGSDRKRLRNLINKGTTINGKIRS